MIQTGHPGVTTMWTGTLGLWGKHLLDHSPLSLPDYLAQVSLSPSTSVGYLVATRLPTAILTAAVVAVTYLLVRRMFGNTAAWVSAGLLAFDPFYLALSRVIHQDALETSFAFLGLLTFVYFVWWDRRWFWLVLSAAFLALGCLSKSTAMFLLPFVGLVGLVQIIIGFYSRPSLRWNNARFWIVTLAAWGVLVAVFFTLFWPAMWVDPVGSVQKVLNTALQYAEEPHSKGNFFLGAPTDDPGVLFYPVAILLRMTPLSLIGLLLSVAIVVVQVRKLSLADVLKRPDLNAMITFLAFVVLFPVFMTFGIKKFDRYMLPVFPAIDVLAGVAFTYAVGKLPSFQPAATGSPGAVRARRGWTGGILVAIVVLQGLLLLPAYPYYFSAYNVLLGGPQVAQKVLLVGWGEGMEQAADYLNAKPNAQDLRAATFYNQDFQAFFKGRGRPLINGDPDNPSGWNESNYVVCYINQMQRDIPNPATVRYFRSLTPEFTFTQNGIPYVQIYKTPPNVPADLFPEDETDQ